MNRTTTLIAVFVLSASAGAATSHLLGPGRDGRAEASVNEARRELDRLALAVRSLQDEQQELATVVDRLRLQPSTAPMTSRVVVDDVDDAVRRWMEEHAAELVPQARAQDEAADAAQDRLRRLPVGEIVDMLRELSDDERQYLWEELGEAGRSGDVLAEMERLAKLSPNDPDAQLELGTAYLYKLFETGPGPAGAELAMKADRAFDAALALDETHWEARFTKAVSLSNWPAFLGKSGEAIRQFEILIDQQSQGPAKPHHAQSYLFLGNMYQQTGETAKALDAWRRGLDQFPGDAALRRQLELAGQ